MANEVLQALASQYFPQQYQDEMLAEIDKTGTLSDETLKKVGITKRSSITQLRDTIQELTVRNPVSNLKDLNQPLIKRIIGDPNQVGTENVVNEANLTDQGLQTRKSLYDQLGNAQGTTDYAALQREIANKLKVNDVYPGSINQVSQDLTNIVKQLGHYPTAAEFKANYGGLVDQQLNNFFNDNTSRDQLSNLLRDQTSAPDTSGDVNRIQDILSGRQEQATNEQSLTDYLSNLPGQLSTSRNDYLSAIDQQNAQQLESQTPMDLANLNSRGALFSGDVQDVLSNNVGNLQANRENIQSQLEAQDNQFYFNAAYQNALRTQLQGQTNYSQFLQGERSRVANEQQSRFDVAQNQLQTNAQNDLLQRQYNQQLSAQRAQLQRQQDLAKSQRTNALYGQIGSTVGAIGGAVVGGPVGAVVGSSVGGAVGGGVGAIAGN